MAEEIGRRILRIRLHGITTDSDGMVSVADCDNNRVQKFTSEGKVLAVIDSKEEGSSWLNTPYMVCMWTIMTYFM